MFNPNQFRSLVIRPVLECLGPVIPYSQEAEDLLFMTAAHESALGTYLKQVSGPALGIYQMEPDTHNDIWDNYLEYREDLRPLVLRLLGRFGSVDTLVFNLAYATAMARIHYYRIKEPLPKKDDYPNNSEEYLKALSQYAKKYYNTEKGKATPEDYYNAYIRYNGNP